MKERLEQRVYRVPTKGYAKIPHCIYDMQFVKKGYCILVFAFLYRRLNNKTGQCNPSIKDIAIHIGISERQVTRVLSILEQKNVIKVLRERGYSNKYKLLPPQEWDWFQVRKIRATKVLTTGWESTDSRSPP